MGASIVITPEWPQAYHVHAIATCAHDVVVGIGGWLFDHARQGWKVSVMLSEPVQSSALNILGISAREIDYASWPSAENVNVVVASTELYERDQALRRHIGKASRDLHTTVWLWDPNGRRVAPHESKALRYTLGNAARVFKTQAMVSAELATERVATHETLYSLKSNRDILGAPTRSAGL
ncbi:hypothetical protein [Mycobacterium sp. MUNTM1]